MSDGDRTILRIEKIEIEAHKPLSKPSIRVVIQRVIEDSDGVPIQIIPGQEEVFKIADNVATESVTVVDPISGNPVSISIAGLRLAMMAIAYSWFAQKHPGQVVDGKFILDDE